MAVFPKQEMPPFYIKKSFLHIDTIVSLLYHVYNKETQLFTKRKVLVTDMIIEIDFNSDEALYLQLRNQIIMGIATSRFHEGDSLPSVRQLADSIGINMHTVNKAYTVLRQEGFVKVDRRRGAFIAIDADKMQAMQELEQELKVVLAKSCCKNISREEVHALIDEIYEGYGGLD